MCFFENLLLLFQLLYLLINNKQKKVEQTASSVLHMFPDLELAIEEGEPQLAAVFFDLVKQWVVELREMVFKTQQINKASMDQVITIIIIINDIFIY